MVRQERLGTATHLGGYPHIGVVPVPNCSPQGGRDNGPYADSFPLRCHFQGGGGGGGGGGGLGLGGVGGQLKGGGGLQTPTYMV